MEFNLEVRAQDGKVYTNASDLLPAIKEGLKKYDYIVDADNYKQAKTDRAALNKLIKVVADKRKDVENDVFSQWLSDKKDIMNIEKEIKSFSDKLGDGINGIDNIEKEQKKAQIKELWSTMTNDKYPFDLVFDEKYLNKSVKATDVEESLKNKFYKAEEQLSFLEASLPEDSLQAEQVIQLFCRTLDLSQATQRVNEIKEAQKKLQEKANAQIEQSKQAQAMNQAQEEQNTTTVPQSGVEAQTQSSGRRYCVFRFEGSREDLSAFNPILRQFVQEHDVKVNILEKGEC